METVPLCWQSKYMNVQSTSSFFAGVSFTGRYLESTDHTLFRTWIVLEQSNQELKSPCRATFGGFFSFEIDTFFSDIELAMAGLSKNHPEKFLTLYLPPEHYRFFRSKEQRRVLESLGFSCDFIDVNYSILTKTWDHSLLSKGNRKKLRQWNESGGGIVEASASDLNDIYEIIKVNRHSLGAEPSISLEGLRKLVSSFTENYQLFIGRVKNNIATVAVTVDTHAGAKYVFFWADVAEYRNLSPVVAICSHLIEICKRDQIAVLDLGCSTDAGRPMEGPMRFKSNLGAERNDKYQLSRPT